MEPESPTPERGEMKKGVPFPLFNVTSTAVPFTATSLRPYVPFHLLLRNGPFEPRSMWKAAFGGIRALQQLSRGVTNNSHSSEPFQIVSGHTLGHVLLWNADTTQLITSCQHFNNVTVTKVVVTTSYVYCLVEKVAGGASSDDSSVYVWNAKTLELVDTLSMHEDRVQCIAVDEANEYRVATGGADHLIFLWNLKKSTTTPTLKVVGHKSTVTRLILTEHVLISGGGDGDVRLWDPKTGKCLHSFDGHQGQVGLMEWTRKPNAGTDFEGTLVTGCHGGFVRTWEYRYTPPNSQFSESDTEGVHSPNTVRTFLLSNGGLVLFAPTFLNKSHKALVADVGVDDINGIVVSCSPTDGVNLFHVDRKHNYKLNSFESGVHNIAIDSERRILVVGTDVGQLAFFAYDGFAGVASVGFGDELVVMVAAFQPHLGGITSMLLERGRAGRLSRIMTSSADNTILTLDFQTDRDATMFGTMSTNSLLKTPNGSLLLPMELDGREGFTTGSAKLFSLKQFQPIDAAKKFADLQGRRATALSQTTYTEAETGFKLSKVLIGTDDGKLRFFDYQMYEPDEPASPGGSNAPEEFIETASIVDLNGFVVRSMTPVGQYVALCLQRSMISAKGGAIAIVDIRSESLVTDPLPLMMYPVEVCMHLFGRPQHEMSTSQHLHHSHHKAPAPLHAQDAALAVHTRTGEVVQIMWRGGSRTLVVQRTLIQEQYTSQQLDDGLAPYPSRILTFLNIKFEPPRLQLVSVDGAFNLRGLEASTGTDSTNPAPMFNASYDQREIIDICSFAQGEVAYVVALDAPDIFIAGQKGERLFQISYDGSVLDCSQPEYANRHSVLHMKRHRTFVSNDRGVFGREYPRCTAVAASLPGRFVAIGYRDGLIQLWDSGTHLVFKRIVAHRLPVASIWCFGEEKRVLSCATSGYLRGDVFWSRSLKDKRNQPKFQFPSEKKKY